MRIACVGGSSGSRPFEAAAAEERKAASGGSARCRGSASRARDASHAADEDAPACMQRHAAVSQHQCSVTTDVLTLLLPTLAPSCRLDQCRSCQQEGTVFRTHLRCADACTSGAGSSPAVAEASRRCCTTLRGAACLRTRRPAACLLSVLAALLRARCAPRAAVARERQRQRQRSGGELVPL